MSIETGRAYLRARGYEDRIQEFSVSSATVELAAQAVGCEPARIAKTLSFKVGERPILVVAAGDARIDNGKYKHFFGVKAKMLTPEEAVERMFFSRGYMCSRRIPASCISVKPIMPSGKLSICACVSPWAAPPLPSS